LGWASHQSVDELTTAIISGINACMIQSVFEPIPTCVTDIGPPADAGQTAIYRTIVVPPPYCHGGKLESQGDPWGPVFKA